MSLAVFLKDFKDLLADVEQCHQSLLSDHMVIIKKHTGWFCRWLQQNAVEAQIDLIEGCWFDLLVVLDYSAKQLKKLELDLVTVAGLAVRLHHQDGHDSKNLGELRVGLEV